MFMLMYVYNMGSFELSNEGRLWELSDCMHGLWDKIELNACYPAEELAQPGYVGVLPV